MMKTIFGSYMLFFGMAMFLSGCREPKDYAIQNELKPTTFAELISMSAEDVERVDIGRLNLICAAEALMFVLSGSDCRAGAAFRLSDLSESHSRASVLRVG